MKTKGIISTVDTHTMGEPTRLIYNHNFHVPGKSMIEKKVYFEENLDFLRCSLIHEPRGHRDMFGAILLPPVSPEADIGVIFMDGGGYLNMCIHSSIGVIKSILEVGFYPTAEPRPTITLDTPAGLIRAEAQIVDGEIKRISIENVPSFLYAADCRLSLPGIGDIEIDIAFGGNFFAIVEAQQLGIPLKKENLDQLIDWGLKIRESANREFFVKHPGHKGISHIDLVVIHAPSENPSAHSRNVTVFGEGQVDRSPCGTGTCARMAALYHKGRIGIGESFINESLLGSTFTGELVQELDYHGFRAVIPRITGNAYLIGLNQWIMEQNDPLVNGFSF